MFKRKPEGYKDLLAYKKTAELQEITLKLVALFPKSKTMIDLADQMARSARSGTKNIVEGWKRNTTKEYFTFLGFSIGSIEELKDDASDVAKGLYGDLVGVSGLWLSGKGERGIMGVKGVINKIKMKLLYKTIFITILFLTIQVGISYAATIGLPLHNAGLVGYWNMNEGHSLTTYDRSGQGNHGTLTNMAEDDWVDGNTGLGGALDFDGSDDYVDAGSMSMIRSVSGWYKLDIFYDFSRLFDWRATNGYSIYCDNTTKCYLRYGESTTNYVTTATLNTNQWYHFVTVHDGSDVFLYLDGSLVGSGTVALNDTSGDFVIGTRGAKDDQYFNGKIDEVRVYNRALSASEINRLYNLTKPKISRIDNTGLVGYWPFEEGQGTTAGDHSFNSNHGTLTNMTDADWVDGKVGKALDFDGTDDYVEVTHNDTSEITISAWINPDSYGEHANGLGRIFDKGGAAGSFSFSLNKDFSGLGTNNIIFYDGDEWEISNSSVISLDTWQHVVVTVNSTTVSFYVDGVYQGGDTGTHTLATSAFNPRIGGSANTTTLEFNGEIDEVRVYNRALSATEVANLYNESKRTVVNKTKKNRITNGLVGHWTFDGPDLTTTSATDSSGNGNNGTLTNGPKPTLGKIGQALEFDGSDDYIDATLSQTDGLSEFTFSTWVSADTIANENRAIATQWVHSSNDKWAIRKQGTSDLRIFIADATTDSGANRGTVSGYFTVGEWIHLAVVFDGNLSGDSNRLKIYKNGVSQSVSYDGTIPSTLTTTTDDTLRIGNFSGSIDQDWDGKIDEVRIYNRALSADEISELYNMGL